jgi:hypothetical protein
MIYKYNTYYWMLLVDFRDTRIHSYTDYNKLMLHPQIGSPEFLKGTGTSFALASPK